MPETQVEIAVLKTEIKHLTDQMEKLTDTVEDLVAVMNKGRGAFGAAMLIVAAVASVVTKVFDKFWN